MNDVSIRKRQLKDEYWDVLEESLRCFFEQNPKVNPVDITIKEVGDELKISAKKPKKEDEKQSAIQAQSELELEESKLRIEETKHDLEIRALEPMVSKQEVIRRNIEVLLRVKCDNEPDTNLKKSVIDKLKKHVEALEVP